MATASEARRGEGTGGTLGHRRAVALLAAGILLVGACFALALLTRPASFYLGGIQVHEPDHQRWLKTLAESGMNTVAVTVYARQGDWDSDNLWFNQEEPWVLAEIRAAKRRGLHVALVLRVALDHAYPRNRFLWHGLIQPRTDDLLASWFERYGRFVRTWAEIAEREGVDFLAVGSELNALASTVPVRELPVLEEYYLNSEKREAYRKRLLEHAAEIEEAHLWVRGGENYPSLDAYLRDEIAALRAWAHQVAWQGENDSLRRINQRRRQLQDHWIGLIQEVREVYRGTLTYAANFDQYPFVGFWDQLDVLGINAYFPLREEWQPVEDPAALYPELKASWRRLLDGLAAFRIHRGLEGKPVILTEIGYTWRANSTLEPWQSGGFSVVPAPEGRKLVVWAEQPPAPRERALAIRALAAAHRGRQDRLLQGILYWKLSTRPEHREIEPFVLVLGEEDQDPMLAELQRFRAASRLEDLSRRILARVGQYGGG